MTDLGLTCRSCPDTGRDRLEKLEREEGELEAKLEAIHQAWKDLPKGRDWEENAIEAEVKELWEEYDECTSRQYKLQDILDKAAGVHSPTAGKLSSASCIAKPSCGCCCELEPDRCPHKATHEVEEGAGRSHSLDAAPSQP